MFLVTLTAAALADATDPRLPAAPAPIEDPRRADEPPEWLRSGDRSRYRAGNWTIATGLGLTALAVATNDVGWASAGLVVVGAGAVFATSELGGQGFTVNRAPLVGGVLCGLGATVTMATHFGELHDDPLSLGLIACSAGGFVGQIALDRTALRRAGLTVSPTPRGVFVAGRF